MTVPDPEDSFSEFQCDRRPEHRGTLTKELQSLLAGNEAPVFHEPFGVPHTRFAGCAWPTNVSVKAIAEASENWFPRHNDVFVAQGPWFLAVESALDLLSPIIALIEQTPVTDDRFVFGKESSVLQAARTSQIQLPNVRSYYTERSIQHILSNGGYKRLTHLGESDTRRCLLTAAPPWISTKRGRAAAAANEELGMKVAVLATDPRYLLMNELKVWDFLKILGPDGPEVLPGPVEKLKAPTFLEGTLTSNPLLGGGVFGNLGAWAALEVQRPKQIRLFFLEDFLLQPEITMRSLARYIGVSEYSDVSERAIADAVAVARRHGFTGTDDCYGLTEMAGVVAEFERLLRDLPQGLQDRWEATANSWRHCPHSRVAVVSDQLLRHADWNPPHWWATHCAGVCSPCEFFPRGACRAREDCGFCHGPGHPNVRRPSQKERRRKSNRRQQRTPSPSGLSS